MTDRLDAHSYAAQIITKQILCIDEDTALGWIADAGTDSADIDTLAHEIVDAAHGARITLSWTTPEKWRIERDGILLHTVTGRDEAQAIGQLLIHAETGDRAAAIRWVCAVCDSEEDLCPACGLEAPPTLHARGILTDGHYEIVRDDT
jgi:hypothetical protein